MTYSVFSGTLNPTQSTEPWAAVAVPYGSRIRRRRRRRRRWWWWWWYETRRNM